MYFTSLPDHSHPGFDENLHFSRFKKHNIVFNALSRQSMCDDHVGCLSLKTTLSGEEWYGLGHRQVAVRPGWFLLLNDEQHYSCRIDSGEETRCFSIFFKTDFARDVFRNTLSTEANLLDEPFNKDAKTLEFFQTLNPIKPDLKFQLYKLLAELNENGYQSDSVDERLVGILFNLIANHRTDIKRVQKVEALKAGTKTELYRRLCIAKDLMHSCYAENPDLDTISNVSCLSVSQLVRQFKAVFQSSPHQYLIQIKLEKAAELLQHTQLSVNEITWNCGFENPSAFCRAFKTRYGVQPLSFRTLHN